jgi:hypothetical protein
MPIRIRKVARDVPLRFRSWTKIIKQMKPKRQDVKRDLLIQRYATDPKLTEAVRLERGRGFVDLIASTERVGKHFFPPSLKTVRLDPKKRQIAELNGDNLAGYRPRHLALRPVPERLPRELKVVRQWRRKGRRKDDLGEPGLFSRPIPATFSPTLPSRGAPAAASRPRAAPVLA